MRHIRAYYSLWATAAILLLGAAGRGADLTLLNGNVDLTISSATAGQQPDQAMDETCQLSWTTLLTDPVKKIVVSTNLAGPRFSLSLRATNVNSGHGTAMGAFVLGTSASDLVVSIPPNLTAGDPGQCNLRYTATATAANGTGSDSHTVTFTITDQ
jgi:hypothetical protein